MSTTKKQPWMEEGYRFWEPGFPPLFEPKMATEMTTSCHDNRTVKSENATKQRQKMLDHGLDSPFGARLVLRQN